MIWGMIISFGEKKKERKNIENNEKICPHSAYIAQGPQGSINVMPEYGSES